MSPWWDRAALWSGGAIIGMQAATPDQASLPGLLAGGSLVGLAAVCGIGRRRTEPPRPAAEEHPLDRHVRIAGMLNENTRAWLLTQAAELPEGAVIHGMAVPAGYLVEVDPTSPPEAPRLHLSLDNDHTPRVATGKIADGEVKAQRVPAGTFELTNAEYQEYRRLVNEAKEIQAMLALTTQVADAALGAGEDDAAARRQAKELYDALDVRRQEIRAASDSWRMV